MAPAPLLIILWSLVRVQVGPLTSHTHWVVFCSSLRSPEIWYFSQCAISLEKGHGRRGERRHCRCTARWPGPPRCSNSSARFGNWNGCRARRPWRRKSSSTPLSWRVQNIAATGLHPTQTAKRSRQGLALVLAQGEYMSQDQLRFARIARTAWRCLPSCRPVGVTSLNSFI